MQDKLSNVQRLSEGKWHSILSEIIDVGALDGKHHPCPMCGGTDRFRFSDKRRSPGDGGYYCTNCGPGDGIDLVARYINITPSAAMDWVLERVDAAQSKRLPTFTSEDALRALRRLKRYSKPSVPFDLVHAYLENRGLPAFPLMYQIAPRALWTVSQGGLYDKLSGKGYNGMLGLVLRPDGRAITVHRTFLETDQQGRVVKATPNPKRVMPVADNDSISGAAIRLFEPEDGIIGIAEGIETALAATVMTNLPCWSVINGEGIASFIPPEGIKEVHIFCDNDNTNRDGEVGFGSFTGFIKAGKLVERLRRSHPKVRIGGIHFPPNNEPDYLDALVRQKVSL